MSAQDDVVDALAVYRLTRLVVEDRVPFGPLREAVKRRALRDWDPTSVESPYLVELLSCRWCASVWVAMAVLVLRRLPGWKYLARILAASAVTGLLSTYEES